MTGTALIASALRLIGVLASGETAQAADQADALTVLNNMIDAWSAEGTTVFNVIRNGASDSTNTFALVANQASYTLGESGSPDFNVARPPKIIKASIEWIADPANPSELEIRYTTDPVLWREKTTKLTTSTIPEFVFDDNGFPNRTLYPWPIPSAVHNLVLYYWVALLQFTAASTDRTYPPAYLEALRYNLAARLASEFHVPIPPDVRMIAAESLSKIKSINRVTPTMRLPDGIPGRSYKHYDWRTDEGG